MKLRCDKIGIILGIAHIIAAYLALLERQVFGGFFYDLFNLINMEIAILAWAIPGALYFLVYIVGFLKWYLIGHFISFFFKLFRRP